MKRIGIIGVGEIGRAIVVGLCDGGGVPPEVFLSPGEPAPLRNCPSATRAYGCVPTTRRWWTAPRW